MERAKKNIGNAVTAALFPGASESEPSAPRVVRATRKRAPPREPRCEEAEICMEDLIAHWKKDTRWPVSFQGSLAPHSTSKAATRCSFHDIFAKNIPTRDVLAWLVAHMGPQCPPFTVRTVNVVFSARSVVVGGLLAQPSMTGLTTMGHGVSQISGNQRTYAAGKFATACQPGLFDRGVVSSVYTAGKVVIAGPPSVDMAAQTAYAVLDSVSFDRPYTLSTIQAKPENMVTVAKIDDRVDLDQLHSLLSQISTYQATNFPALIIKLRTGVTLLVYESGHIIATGSPSPHILVFTTTFFISNCVHYCLHSRRGAVSLDNARKHVFDSALGGLIDSSPRMVSDRFASETGLEQPLDLAYLPGMDSEQSEYDDYEYSETALCSMSDSGSSSTCAAAETHTGIAQGEAVDVVAEGTKKRSRKSRLRASRKRRRALRSRESGADCNTTALVDLADQYGADVHLLMGALSQL